MSRPPACPTCGKRGRNNAQGCGECRREAVAAADPGRIHHFSDPAVSFKVEMLRRVTGIAATIDRRLPGVTIDETPSECVGTAALHLLAAAMILRTPEFPDGWVPEFQGPSRLVIDVSASGTAADATRRAMEAFGALLEEARTFCESNMGEALASKRGKR